MRQMDGQAMKEKARIMAEMDCNSQTESNHKEAQQTNPVTPALTPIINLQNQK